jgi:hypothetical protein
MSKTTQMRTCWQRRATQSNYETFVPFEHKFLYTLLVLRFIYAIATWHIN